MSSVWSFAKSVNILVLGLLLVGCVPQQAQTSFLRNIMIEEVSTPEQLMDVEMLSLSSETLNGSWLASVSSEIELSLVVTDSVTGQTLSDTPIADLERLGLHDQMQETSSFKMLQNQSDLTKYQLSKCGVPNEGSAFIVVEQPGNILLPSLNAMSVLSEQLESAKTSFINFDVQNLAEFVANKIPGTIEENKKVVFDPLEIVSEKPLGDLASLNEEALQASKLPLELLPDITLAKQQLALSANASVSMRSSQVSKMVWLKVADKPEQVFGNAAIENDMFEVDCFSLSKKWARPSSLASSTLEELSYFIADKAKQHSIALVDNLEKVQVDAAGVTELIYRRPANGSEKAEPTKSSVLNKDELSVEASGLLDFVQSSHLMIDPDRTSNQTVAVSDASVDAVELAEGAGDSVSKIEALLDELKDTISDILDELKLKLKDKLDKLEEKLDVADVDKLDLGNTIADVQSMIKEKEEAAAVIEKRFMDNGLAGDNTLDLTKFELGLRQHMLDFTTTTEGVAVSGSVKLQW